MTSLLFFISWFKFSQMQFQFLAISLCFQLSVFIQLVLLPRQTRKKRHPFPKCKNKDSPLTYLLIIFNISECNVIIPFKYNSTCNYRSLPYWGHSDNYINSQSHLQNKTKNYIRFTDINSHWINARKQVLKIRFYTARYLLVPQSKNCQWSIYD